MSATYKYITIEESDGDYHVRNRKSGSLLGMIEWYPSWRQWVFVTESSALWSWDCLRDISEFMRQLPKRGEK